MCKGTFGLKMGSWGKMGVQRDFWVKNGVWGKMGMQRDFWIKSGVLGENWCAKGLLG